MNRSLILSFVSAAVLAVAGCRDEGGAPPGEGALPNNGTPTDGGTHAGGGATDGSTPPGTGGNTGGGGNPAARIQPSDLQYLGAFRPSRRMPGAMWTCRIRTRKVPGGSATNRFTAQTATCSPFPRPGPHNTRAA